MCKQVTGSQLRWRRAGARALAGLIVAASLAACSSSSKTNVETQTTTIGQELQDLDKARNDGLLTEREYQEQREAILKRAKK